MATHSSALAWKIPWTGEPGGLQSMGPQSQTRLSDFTSLTSLTSYFITGEGNGNPLQYSCLKNLMDRGAWRAMVHGVTESRTWLKWLSTHIHIYTYIYHHHEQTAGRSMNIKTILVGSQASDRNEKYALGNWRKFDPRYKMAKNLAKLSSCV